MIQIRLKRTLAIRRYILQYAVSLKADREGPDQTTQIHRLSRLFAVSVCPEGIFFFFYIERLMYEPLFINNWNKQ